MQLPNLKANYWELRSAEKANREHPETFWIPARQERENLKRGQAAKLLFQIEGEDEKGNISVVGEKMWVIVTGKEDGFYLGILSNQPACLDPRSDVYLRFGAEIPFLAEHVADIADPPAAYVEWQLGQPPERKWSR